MKTDRVERLLKLLTALHSGRTCSPDELADELGIARRTLFRDLNLLERVGTPFHFDYRHKCYRIDRDFFVPPVDLTVEECLALLFLTRKLLQDSWVLNDKAAARAVMKLESALPPELQRHCGFLLSRVDFHPPPISSTDGLCDHFNVLQSAVAEQRKVAIDYEPPEKPSFDDIIHPLHLLFIRRGWYVIARSERFDELRTFKVERLASCVPLKELFLLAEPFKLTDYLGHAWSLIRGQPRCRVRIRFTAMVATNVEEIVWHKTQRTFREEDGSLIFEVEVDGIHEISWWILGYGDQAEVLEPPELRTLLRERARSMLSFYEPPVDSKGDAPSCAR